jgi:hypothetical protein
MERIFEKGALPGHAEHAQRRFRGGEPRLRAAAPLTGHPCGEGRVPCGPEALHLREPKDELEILVRVLDVRRSHDEREVAQMRLVGVLEGVAAPAAPDFAVDGRELLGAEADGLGVRLRLDSRDPEAHGRLAAQSVVRCGELRGSGGFSVLHGSLLGWKWL